jgi:hypothetical protein
VPFPFVRLPGRPFAEDRIKLFSTTPTVAILHVASAFGSEGALDEAMGRPSGAVPDSGMPTIPVDFPVPLA